MVPDIQRWGFDECEFAEMQRERGGEAGDGETALQLQDVEGRGVEVWDQREMHL